MDDLKALEAIKNMGETDLLNLYHGYYSADQANNRLSQEYWRLQAEVARLAAELAVRTDERDHYAAACSRIDQALAEARGELGQWRDAFSWVEQHVTTIHVGFVNENHIRVNWIDNNGNDREGACDALLDLVQKQLRLADRKGARK